MKRVIIFSIVCLLCAVSTMAADKLVISDITVTQGNEAVIDIGCQMQTACKAFQMDVELGSGFTLKLDATGKPVAELGTSTDHKVYSRRVSNGKYRFVVLSTNGQQLPKSGSLLKLTVVAPSSAQAGSSITGWVKAIEFTTAQKKRLLMSNVSFKVTIVSTPTQGDTNGDNVIDLADIATIIDVMVGSADVSSASADVNEDGTVDVADIMAVISIMAGAQEPVTPISVTTGNATNITSNSAVVNGTVKNVDEPTNVGVLYGTSSTLSIDSDMKSMTTSKGSFALTLSGLTAGTTYYYCAFAEADGKYYYGETKSFKTEKTTETLLLRKTWDFRTGFSQKTVNALKADQEEFGPDKYWRNYEGDATKADEQHFWNASKEAKNSDGYACTHNGGMEKVIPELEGLVLGMSNAKKFVITYNGAQAPNEYEAEGGPALGEMIPHGNSYVWLNGKSETIKFKAEVNQTIRIGIESHAVNRTKLGEARGISLAAEGGTLTPHFEGNPVPTYYTEYEWELTGTDGDVATITLKSTNACHIYFIIVGEDDDTPIAVATGNATNITSNSAVVNGTVKNVDEPINVGVLYGTSSTLSIDSDMKSTTTSKGNFTLTLSGLTAGTTYYYCAFVEADGKYYYGETKSFMTTINAATIDDVQVCKHNYVLCFDDWDGAGTAKPGKGSLFGNGYFLDVTGGSVATNKGKVNLSVVNEADDNHVTQYIADKYGADYPDDHYNSWRLKDTQDMIAMKVTAKTKLIFFLQGNNKKGTAARIPCIAKSVDDIKSKKGLNPAPDADFPTTNAGFRYEWIAPDDMTIYIGTYNGDTFFSFLIVEVSEGDGTPIHQQ